MHCIDNGYVERQTGYWESVLEELCVCVCVPTDGVCVVKSEVYALWLCFSAGKCVCSG